MVGEDRVQDRRRAARDRSSHALPLVGRTGELAGCLGALDQALIGGAQTLCLVGEAGIGKSRLLQELLLAAEGRGWRPLVGRAEMLERERQGAVLADALRPPATEQPVSDLASSFARMLELAPVDPVASADAFVDAMSAALLSGPVLIAVENLEWCDHTSLLGLRLLLRDHGEAAVLVVLAARSRAALAAATRDWPVTVRPIPLTPLTAGEVAKLAATTLRADPGAGLVHELQGTGGNPLFVLELLAALEAEDRITRSGSGADLLAPALPEGFRQTVVRRLGQLPEATVRLLKVGAVLGTRFSATSVAIALDQPVATFIDDLVQAVDAGLLEEVGDDLVFRHDLAREAIYQEIGPATRVALHLDVATRLDAAGSPADAVLPHLLASARQSDPRALELLVSQAQRDRGSAPARAAVLFEQALAVLEPQDPRRPALTAAMLSPLSRSGRMGEAEGLARSLIVAPPDPRSVFLAHEALWLVLLRTGRLQEYRADAARVLEELDLEPLERAMASARLANVMTLTGDAAAARPLATIGAEEAAAQGLHGLEAFNRSTLAFVELAAGDVAAALSAAQASSAADRRHPDRVQNVQLYLACTLAEADRLGDATAVAREGRAYDETIGDHSVVAVYHWVLGYIAYLSGDWASASAELESVLNLRGEREVAEIALPLGLAIAGRVALHRGDETAATRLVSEWHRLAPVRGPQIGDALLHWCDALLRRRQGDGEGALAAARRAWRARAGNRYLLFWRLIAPDIVDIALGAGDTALAGEVAETAAQGARRAGDLRSSQAAAAHCQGLLDGDTDRLGEAEAAWTASDRPAYAALAARHLGGLLAKRGDRDGAEAALQRALAGYDGLGAAADAAELAAELAGLGGGPPRRRVVTGWESLTRAERDVVELVQEGLTNRQIGERLFISRHTVDSHLRHVFQKLGVRSRTELASRATAAAMENHANA